MKSRSLTGIITLIFLGMLWVGLTSAADNKAWGGKPIIVGGIGLATPESVEYYSAADVYLVSNINGSPFAKDGNGFISRIKPDGTVIDLKWIDGSKPGVTLNAPKGLAINGTFLFVADRDQVQVFRVVEGQQTNSITIPGSTFLNGITAGPGGSVYVSDSGFDDGFKPNGTDAIYQVWPNGKYKVMVKNKNMDRPNGILKLGRQIIMVPFGSDKMFFYSLNGKQTKVLKTPAGSLDGLIRLPDGRLLFSSWASSSIYSLKRDKFSVFAEGLDAPADIGFDTRRKRVLVPLFKQNKLAFIPLK